MEKPSLAKLLEDPARFQSVALILGAGASSYARLPNTSQLTTALAESQTPRANMAGGDNYYIRFKSNAGLLVDEPFDAWTIPAGELIRQAALETSTGFSDYVRPNFEDMLHVTEELLTYSAPRSRYPEYRRVRPVIEALTDPAEKWRILFDASFLATTKTTFVRIIIDKILSVTDLKDKTGPLKTLIEPLSKRARIDCFTLNYDELADHAFDDAFLDTWTDGFEKKYNAEGYSAFKSARLESLLPFTRQHRLCHLHGHVRFGYSLRQKKNTQPSLEIVKYNPSEYEKQMLSHRLELQYVQTNQAQEIFQGGPIISGLRKYEKLASMPYAYYYKTFIDSLYGANAVVIVGYGGHDEHINSWLRESQDAKPNRRVIEVTKKSEAFIRSHPVLERVMGCENSAWNTHNTIQGLRFQGNYAIYDKGLELDGTLPIDAIIEFTGLKAPAAARQPG